MVVTTDASSLSITTVLVSEKRREKRESTSVSSPSSLPFLCTVPLFFPSHHHLPPSSFLHFFIHFNDPIEQLISLPSSRVIS